MKFYKRDPDRALAGMAELTLKQRGAYNSLLDLLYSRDGEVPDDDTRVARMISCHWREWAAVKRDLIAAEKIWIEGGKIRAKRVQETIKEVADFSQEQRKRVSKRWQKTEKDKENNTPSIPLGNTNIPIPIPSKEEPSGSSPPSPPRRNGGSELEDNWQPDDGSYRVGRKEGYTDEEIEWLAEGFRTHSHEKRRRHKKPQLAFHSWLRSAYSRRDVAERRKAGGAPNPQSQSGSGGLVSAIREVGGRLQSQRERSGAEGISGEGRLGGSGADPGNEPDAGEPGNGGEGVNGNGVADEDEGRRSANGANAGDAVHAPAVSVPGGRGYPSLSVVGK